MKKYKILILISILTVLTFSLSGCALLQLPIELIKIPLALIKGIVQVANKVPKPPPWVFF